MNCTVQYVILIQITTRSLLVVKSRGCSISPRMTGLTIDSPTVASNPATNLKFKVAINCILAVMNIKITIILQKTIINKLQRYKFIIALIDFFRNKAR